MPTVIDSLVVEVALDASKFKKGSAEAQAETKRVRDLLHGAGKDVERSAEGMSLGISNLGTKLLGLTALFTAGVGLKQFVQQTVTTDMHIGRLSNVLGV